MDGTGATQGGPAGASDTDSGIGTGSSGSSGQGFDSSGQDHSQGSGSSGFSSGGSSGSSGQGFGSSGQDHSQGSGSSGFFSAESSSRGSASLGQDTASTITDGTLQDHSQRYGSSGFFSGGSGSLTSSNLSSLPKLDMIELFLRPESQNRDEKTATRLQMRPDQTITELQKEVHRVTRVHPGQQYLLHEETGSVLSGSTAMATRTIRSCNITNRTWLKYSARSRGGGGVVQAGVQ